MDAMLVALIVEPGAVCAIGALDAIGTFSAIAALGTVIRVFHVATVVQPRASSA